MANEYTVQSLSEANTENIGAALGDAVMRYGMPCYISLDGDMGAGKTAFVRGIASVLSPGSRVKSPTYTIVNEYRKGTLPLFHFDMYRIADAADELFGIGFDYYLSEGVCVAEWSSALGDDAPPSQVSVQIKKIGESMREIAVRAENDFPKIHFAERRDV